MTDIFDITVEEKLSLKWKVVDCDELVDGDRVEDISIFTIDNREVIGCSEWMRGEREIFDHIVAIHNESVNFDVLLEQCKGRCRRC